MPKLCWDSWILSHNHYTQVHIHTLPVKSRQTPTSHLWPSFFPLAVVCRALPHLPYCSPPPGGLAQEVVCTLSCTCMYDLPWSPNVFIPHWCQGIPWRSICLYCLAYIIMLLMCLRWYRVNSNFCGMKFCELLFGKVFHIFVLPMAAYIVILVIYVHSKYSRGCISAKADYLAKFMK